MPQGSVFGPTLFLIIVNEDINDDVIVNITIPGVLTKLCVDDIKLYATSSQSPSSGSN